MDKKKNKNDQVEQPKEKYEGHGNNWRAVIDNFEKEDVISIAKEIAEDENSLVINTDFFLGMINYDPPICGLALIFNNKEAKQLNLYSLYPFLQVQNPVEVEIAAIDEWSNQVEAVISGHVGEASVCFFDSLYFYNKEKYQIGKTYIFNLVGLAHSFAKRTKDLEITIEKAPFKGERLNSAGMTGYLPSHEYGGEFVYYHPFANFDEKITAFNSNFYRFQFNLASAINDNETIFSFPIYVREQLLNNYIPVASDPIVGTGWLQGYLADSFNNVRK